jgi:hypothetical protein
MGFGVDLRSTSLNLAIGQLDLFSDAFPHFFPLHRWLFRHLCLVACLMSLNASIHPLHLCFNNSLIVPIALPLPKRILLLSNALRCCCLPSLSCFSVVVPLDVSPLQAIDMELNAGRSTEQAALSQHTSSFLKTLRHRHGSDPPTDFEGSGHLPAGVFSNIICGSPAMPLLNATFKLIKPIRFARSLRTPSSKYL